jgi:hypothetical protein
MYNDFNINITKLLLRYIQKKLPSFRSQHYKILIFNINIYTSSNVLRVHEFYVFGRLTHSQLEVVYGCWKMTARFHISSLNWLTETYVIVNHTFLGLQNCRASFVPPGSNCSIASCLSEWYCVFSLHTVSVCCCIILSLPPGSYT